ncbi:MAG: aconitate hydratase, partial [bacterium (Candidatus Stahlbacteria) CG23_combo_of_CG06-09_8_20_14_all_40_9]
QGSSREHAAICPAYLGVKAVIAKSIERIHWANLINFGVIPLIFADVTDYDKIKQSDELSLLGIDRAVKENNTFVIRNLSKDTDFAVKLNLSEREREILLTGGLLNLIGKKAKG